MGLAFFYHPDGYDTSRPKLMGRHAAGEEFLKAYVRHSGAERFYCYAARRAHYQDFARRVAPLLDGRPTAWIPHRRLGGLAEPGTLFLPGPNLGDYAWQRRFSNPRGYSLVGVTHTTATQRIMDAFGDFLLAPVQPWDALICTSQVVKSTVERVLNDWGAYLRERLGARPSFPVRLPVIPLGVDCDALEPTPEKREAGAKLRQKLGIGEDDVAALFLGRLSFHAKANPLPMYLGLERAAQQSKKRLHLILAGWFGADIVRKGFLEGAKALCPSVKLVVVDGRKPEIRRHIWFAADLFTSLSDNVQETFGLTPIEAMAAGLPVVATDWDGYRDTVRDGIEGFLVPTYMPGPGLGRELARDHFLGVENYDRYVGRASLATAADVDRAAEAYTRLALDQALRRKLGEAGRARARKVFDWSVIIAAYEALFAELAELRKSADELAPRRAGAPLYPLRADPFRVFASYPTEVIGPEHRVALTSGFGLEQFRLISKLAIASFGTGLFASEESCALLIERLDKEGPKSVRALVKPFEPSERVAVQRTLGWLAKMGGVRFEKAE